MFSSLAAFCSFPLQPNVSLDCHCLWQKERRYRLLMAHFVYSLQRHDIIKKRIDHLGNVIESKSDGIGAPKVCFTYVYL